MSRRAMRRVGAVSPARTAPVLWFLRTPVVRLVSGTVDRQRPQVVLARFGCCALHSGGDDKLSDALAQLCRHVRGFSL